MSRKNTEEITEQDRFRGCLLGLAVGDAVGAAVEFRERGSFEPVRDMIGGGPFGLKPGQWTDERNWRNLRGQMTEDDVRRLLGRPERTKTVGKFEYWYYDQYKVVFYLGRVDSWLAP